MKDYCKWYDNGARCKAEVDYSKGSYYCDKHRKKYIELQLRNQTSRLEEHIKN